jgi:hypothetical protein
MFARRIALAVAGVALAVPAAAHAGSITFDKACYVHIPPPFGHSETMPINVSVAGGTPGGDFQVVLNGGKSGSETGTFDATGNGVAQIQSVFPPSGSIEPLSGDTLPVTVHDFASGTDIATGSTLITNAAIQVARKPINPYRKRVIRVSGLTPLFGPGPLYASFVSGFSGTHVVKTVKLGTPNGCGYLRTKKVLPPRHGVHKWAMYVHVGRALDKSKSLKYAFRVYRRFI